MTVRGTWLRLAALVILAAGAAAVLGHDVGLGVTDIDAGLRGLGVWAPAMFIALYVAGTLLFLPGSVLSLAGGALFGPVWGLVFNLSGATLGASLAFLTARYVAGDVGARRSGPRLRRLIAGVEAEGWRFVAIVRLLPFLPFNLLNYALGLTQIPVLPYAATSFLCMLPGAVAYTWAGHAGRGLAERGGEALPRVLPALALLAPVGLLPRLIRRLRRPASVPGPPGLTGP